MLSDETVAIPPQKWHLIATTFKTNTRKGQFADLPGRSGTFADFRLTSAAFLGAQARSPTSADLAAFPGVRHVRRTFGSPRRPSRAPTLADLRLTSAAFAGADVSRRSSTFAWPRPAFAGAD